MKHKTNYEGGFTLIETMAAVGIVTIALSILSAAAVLSFRNTVDPVDFLFFGIRLLRADTLVRDKVEAVTVPYWDLNFDPAQQDGSLVIPWYGGRKEDRLVFYLSRDGELIMETESRGKKEKQTLINKLESADISVWRDKAQIPRGIDILYRYQGRVYQTRSAFGSSPIGREMP
jgi:hypothetical protein